MRLGFLRAGAPACARAARHALAMLVWLLLCPAASAAVPVPPEIPETLRPWAGWALRGAESHACPPAYDDAAVEPRRCAWIARLAVVVARTGGEFRQTFETYRELWVPLPGDARTWPLQVRLDGKPVGVVARDERPGVLVGPGTYTVTGTFLWDAPPEALRVPAEAGIVALEVLGRAVDTPRLDADGRLWIEGSSVAAETTDRLEVNVARRIEDDVPLRALTRFELVASGRPREVLLPAALLEGFVPLALSSPLPARVEPDGRLRVQVRPGRWEVTLDARRMTATTQLALPPAASGEPARNELWSFAARNELRIVTVEGTTPVDPRQTEVPDTWKSLPAWRVRSGEGLRFSESRRGDPTPAPDALTLERTAWLDFDGAGFTLRDHIGGTLSRSWRLELAAPAVLGRAAVDGVDQLVTRSAGGGQGIEVRAGRANVLADSRIDEPLRTLPATGWQQDFQQVTTQLNLPPGWRLLAAAGVDRASGAWVGQWNNLLDFFLVLVIVVACLRLWGVRWALVALVAMVLSWHEADAPRWLWLIALTAAALARVVPAGPAARLVLLGRRGVLVGLALVLIAFAVDQVREAMYPVLERPHDRLGEPRVPPVPNQAAAKVDAASQAEAERTAAKRAAAEKAAVERLAAEKAAAERAAMARAETQRKTAAEATRPAATEKTLSYHRTTPERPPLPDVAASAPAPPLVVTPIPAPVPAAEAPRAAASATPGTPTARTATVSEIDRVDPRALVQTGPGLPLWSWRVHEIAWSGPVEKNHQVDLWLLPPWATAAVTLARLAASFLLLWRLAGAVRTLPSMPVGGAAVAPLVLAIALSGAPHEARAEMPSKDLLRELRERILAAPQCLPECASIARLQAAVADDTLQLRLEVHAAIDAAVPLPGAAGQWLPQQVLVNGKPWTSLARDERGTLWIAVRRGVQELVLQGTMSGRESVQVPFPLRPRRVDVQAPGWSVEGVRENGIAESTLQLRREQQRSTGDAPQDALPPFVVVERTLTLGLQWQVTTRVRRLSPSNSPIVLEVALLPGEAVTSPEPRVERGHALVSMGTQAAEVQWVSALQEQPEIVLRATQQPNQIEHWRLNAGTQWRVATAGLAPIHHQADDRWMPRWQPWPGEEVRLTVARPEGLPGRTLTLEQSRLSFTPGARVSDVELALRLRASRGGEHVVQLPEGAVLQRVLVNGREQPLRLEERSLRVPVVPGEQEITAVWRESRGVGTLMRTPAPDLGLPGVNAGVTVAMPEDRWTLFAGGPRAGPAVLFWGVLIVVLAVALALGRTGLTPLRWWQWLLLGTGLTQSTPALAAIVVLWLFALAGRERYGEGIAADGTFKIVQVGLVALTLAALACLFAAVGQGLLGTPDMQIVGNGSNAQTLNWYQDRIADTQPQAWVLSLPVFAYRSLMLVWALWLAWSLLGWLAWAWRCWTRGGHWREPRLVVAAPAAGTQDAAGADKPAS